MKREQMQACYCAISKECSIKIRGIDHFSSRRMLYGYKSNEKIIHFKTGDIPNSQLKISLKREIFITFLDTETKFYYFFLEPESQLKGHYNLAQWNKEI